MNAKEIQETLQEYFANNLLYSETTEEIDADASLIDNGYIDSTGIIGLVTFLEQAFQIRILDREIIPENFNTLNNLYRFIESKLEKIHV